MRLWIISMLLVCLAIPVCCQDLTTEISAMNKQMEDWFRNGQLQELANVYLDEAILLSPGNTLVKGRQNIDEYWLRIANPVDWKLDVIFVSDDESKIKEHPYWKSLQQKPPDWHDYIDDGLKTDLVYQLGHSTLTTVWEGKERSSEVDFLLVWKKTEEGYRILVDTYSW